MSHRHGRIIAGALKRSQAALKKTHGRDVRRLATNPAHAPRVCPDLRSAEAGDGILSCLADVLCFPSSSGDTQAQVVVAIPGLVVVAVRRPAVPRRVVPATAAIHAVRASFGQDPSMLSITRRRNDSFNPSSDSLFPENNLKRSSKSPILTRPRTELRQGFALDPRAPCPRGSLTPPVLARLRLVPRLRCGLRTGSARSPDYSAGTRETRKPRLPLRSPGSRLPRSADRQYPAGSSQPPPRATRIEPPVGPVGSSTGDSL